MDDEPLEEPECLLAERQPFLVLEEVLERRTAGANT
jgi:hypothetical protein